MENYTRLQRILLTVVILGMFALSALLVVVYITSWFKNPAWTFFGTLIIAPIIFIAWKYSYKIFQRFF